MQRKDLAIAEEMPFLFWFKDEEGRYLWANRAISELAKTDVIGKKDSELPWAEDADALRVGDNQVLETGQPRFLHESVKKPTPVTLNVCKWAGELDGTKGVFGISFVIDS
jgi:PAS domain-containing protein